MEYGEHVKTLSCDYPELARELAGFHTLENVMEWMRQRNLPLGSVDLVTQDEFAHDFLVPLGVGGQWLAIGVT